MKTRKTTRVVTVPQPMIAVATFQLPSNRPLDVVLAEDEDVEWIWSSLPGGLSYISGYKVVKDEGTGSKKP